MNNPELNVNEIFYSLQGEGARAGTANVFIRLQGCKAKDACYASGIRCDTEFESGKVMTIPDLYEIVDNFNCKSIIWTGGEPATQLTAEIVHFFREAGFFQAIETSGLFPVPGNLDWISLSPKCAEHVAAKNFKKVNELRYVRHSNQALPSPSVIADHYFLSPHSDGGSLNSENLNHCINLCLQNPTWKLSIQQHKLWKVL